MPELAEVEYYRKQWDPGIGHRVLALRLHARKRVFRGSDTREMIRRLTGARLLRSTARGKRMLFVFSGDNPDIIGAREGIRSWLGIHLGMSGRLRTEKPGFRPDKHDHLVLDQARQSLVFRDPRLFGRVRFHHGRTEPDWWRSSTPEIGSPEFDRKFMDEFLRRHSRATIKAVLLMQSGFSGIGNWMADEILWRAKISPARRVGKLRPAERSALRRATRFVAGEALRTTGHDLSDPPETWLLHQRWSEHGECPRHGTPLRRDQIGGRTTAWCPLCQK
jgi:formamidopyrimidine-DNA glycosylase